LRRNCLLAGPLSPTRTTRRWPRGSERSKIPAGRRLRTGPGPCRIPGLSPVDGRPPCHSHVAHGQPVEHKLAAIPAADVIEYSRLLGVDGAGTPARLKALRKEPIEPRIVRHRGRTIKPMGGGVLVEFPSVGEAVECAIEARQVTAEHQARVAEGKPITLRIGIGLERTCGCLCHIGTLSARMSGWSVGESAWFPGVW
jgi:class 3 adenylate cyclase